MNNQDTYTTDFLFTTPSFLTGAANILNLAGNFYEFNTSDSDKEADCKAIKNDFNIVGKDFEKALSLAK